MKTISIIAAIGENRELGKDNKLLWNIKKDLKRFKDITIDSAVIMGRKTYKSIGKPLPKRINIIVTREKKYKASGCYITHSLKKAIELAKKKNKQIFIIGGGQIYEQAIPFTDKLYLTIVKGKYSADTYFPDYSAFRKVVYKKQDREGKYRFTFLKLEKDL